MTFQKRFRLAESLVKVRVTKRQKGKKIEQFTTHDEVDHMLLLDNNKEGKRCKYAKRHIFIIKNLW